MVKPIVEKVNIGLDRSILAFRYNQKNFDIGWHCHPQHELTYIEESRGTRFVGDNVAAYQPGELVLLRSKLPYCWRNDESAKGASVSTVIQWNPDIFQPVPELHEIFQLLKQASRGLIFGREQTATLTPIVLQLPELKGALLYTALLNLLIMLSACQHRYLSQAAFEADLPDGYTSRMATIHEFVQNRYSHKIYLHQVAERVSLSEQSFFPLFYKNHGAFIFRLSYGIPY